VRVLSVLVLAVALAAVALVVLDPLERVGGEAREPERGAEGAGERPEERGAPAGRGREGGGEGGAASPREGDRRRAPRPALPRLRCPRDVGGCASVSGAVVLVEAVDPDGDGDLHVVVTDGDVTAPGLTAIDIAPELRPRRDPEIGSVVSAAGPVQRGSFGQAQIHALRVRFGA